MGAYIYIYIYTEQGRRLRMSLRGHGKDIYSVDYSADGRHILSGSGDRRAKLWDAVSGSPCISLSLSLSFSLYI